MDRNILDKISEFNYKDVDGDYVVQVYVKETFIELSDGEKIYFDIKYTEQDFGGNCYEMVC